MSSYGSLVHEYGFWFYYTFNNELMAFINAVGYRNVARKFRNVDILEISVLFS